MPVKFRNFDRIRGCTIHTVQMDNDGKITAPVGAGGANKAADTRTVQALLNGIGPLEGGPPEQLAVDGIVGPKTLYCIRRFQLVQFGWHDGRIDPNGHTIKLLREPKALSLPITPPTPTFGAKSAPAHPSSNLSPSAPIGAKKDPLPPPPKMKEKMSIYATRIARAQLAFPHAKLAVGKAISWLNNAIRWSQAAHLKTENDFVAFADKHFKTGRKHSRSLTGDLFAILQVFRQIDITMDARVGLFGGTPWGSKIFDIDRFPNLNRGAAAYTGAGAVFIPSSKVDHRYNHPSMGGTVYLCDSIDDQNEDFFIASVIHEIAHMVGPKSGAIIDDHGYGDEVGKYNSLGKWHRMHNAENYCIFAFEAQFGTKRLMGYRNNDGFLVAPVVRDDGKIVN